LKQVHIEGFAAHQVWLQARRILDASLEGLEWAVREAVRENEDGKAAQNDTSDINMQDGWEEEKERSHDSDSERMVTSLSTSTSDAEGTEYQEHIVERVLSAPSNEEEVSDAVSNDSSPHDPFFSIKGFNQQVSLLAQHDYNSDDGDNIDWDTNPLAGPPNYPAPSSHSANQEMDVLEDDDDEDEDDQMLTEQRDKYTYDYIWTGGEANAIMYNNFFAPPTCKRALKSTGTARAASNAASDEGSVYILRTIDAVHREL
jgi:U3 small nucleolar ribonucleoprotein component